VKIWRNLGKKEKGKLRVEEVERTWGIWWTFEGKMGNLLKK